MIVIEDTLENTHFDLIFTSPDHKITNFAIDYDDKVVYFLANLTGASTLISRSVYINQFTVLFASTVVGEKWKVETIRFSLLEKLLKVCPEDRVAALSESLLSQIEAYEPDLVQDSIRTKMKALIRSYIPEMAPVTSLGAVGLTGDIVPVVLYTNVLIIFLPMYRHIPSLNYVPLTDQMKLQKDK
jgi:hypothetical protein